MALKGLQSGHNERTNVTFLILSVPPCSVGPRRPRGLRNPPQNGPRGSHGHPWAFWGPHGHETYFSVPQRRLAQVGPGTTHTSIRSLIFLGLSPGPWAPKPEHYVCYLLLDSLASLGTGRHTRGFPEPMGSVLCKYPPKQTHSS